MDTALHSVLLVAGVLVVLILAAIAFIVYRKAFSAAQGEARPPADTPVADPLAAAAAEEKRGNFAAAASLYEAGGEKLKAAACWEKIKDFARAAECWETGGDLERAAQFHVRSGSALRAAGIYMRTKNYIEAAKIFRNKGDHLRAAQALELYGNKLAAAREYTAAGEHARAAGLLETERLYAEAAAAFQPLLGGAEVTAANANLFSRHAALLERAGDREGAAAAYRRVLLAVPQHPVALAAVQSVQPPAPGAEEYEFLEPEAPEPPSPSSVAIPREATREATLDQDDPLKRVFTLRSMIRAGRMEPRYSMRLWVQVMRALAELHGANRVLGCLTPDSIVIDMENNVRIDAPVAPGAVYQSPEVQAGLPADRQADIYSMGIILYELVCGSLEQYGRRRAGELFSDVPPWLDELIEHCTEKHLTRRYRTTEDVSAALVRLKNAAPE